MTTRGAVRAALGDIGNKTKMGGAGAQALKPAVKPARTLTRQKASSTLLPKKENVEPAKPATRKSARLSGNKDAPVEDMEVQEAAESQMEVDEVENFKFCFE